MPTIEVTTTQAKEVWRSPDGQRVLQEVVLDVKGHPFRAKTYSSQIAEVGWTGTVETYEKEGKRGMETFVKQPQKEGFSGGKSFTPRDDSHIKAQWAIGQAGLLIEDKTDLAGIEALAVDLFAMVDRVKSPVQTETEKLDVVHDVSDDEPVDLSSLDEMFPNE